MNRILLISSLALSNAVIDAHNKGISQPEIYHAANVLDQLERGSRRIVSTPKAIIKKMVSAKVKDISLIINSDLTRGQIAYAIKKHLEQQKAANFLKKKKKNKTKAAKVSPMQRKLNERIAFVKKETAIVDKLKKSFSSPLKIQAFQASVIC